MKPRRVGLTASAFPDEAASPDIGPGRAGRAASTRDHTPPPNLLEALRGAFPTGGRRGRREQAKSGVQNASDEEVNRVDPETGDLHYC